MKNFSVYLRCSNCRYFIYDQVKFIYRCVWTKLKSFFITCFNNTPSSQRSRFPQGSQIMPPPKASRLYELCKRYDVFKFHQRNIEVLLRGLVVWVFDYPDDIFVCWQDSIIELEHVRRFSQVTAYQPSNIYYTLASQTWLTKRQKKLTLSRIFLSPSLTILGTGSVMVVSLDDALEQWAAVSTNFGLMRELPHLKIQVPTAAFHPMAPW